MPRSLRLLGWRLAVGATDAIDSHTPRWCWACRSGWAIVACAALAGLLALAALVTAAGRCG